MSTVPSGRELLGRDVVERAHGLARAGHFVVLSVCALEAGQAQVEDLHLPGGRDHQVRRLDVAVDQPVLVGVLQPEGRLPDQLAGVGDRQRPAVLHQLIEVQAVDEFHHQELRAVDLAGVECADDVRMVNRADDLHLALEAGDGLRVIEQPLRQDFQGHGLVELDVPGPIDRAHAAFAQLLEQFVVAQRLQRR